MVDSGAEGGPNVSAAERAAALEAKLGKRRAKPKDQAAIKDAHWRRYNELDRTVDPVASVAPAAIQSGVLRRPADAAPSAPSPIR